MGAATQLSTDIAERRTATIFATPPLLDRSRAQRGKRLQSTAWTRRPRLSGEKLERACRIVLMEIEEPASVEVIYDRIVKRGCVVFAGYRRPFRAITLAMTSLVRRGEVAWCVRHNKASVIRGGRTRFWFRVNR